ncbi:MAG: hypothetical protein HQ583_10915 [Candidatus Abyssubacteria bacterium]|nr:hypothetical protein [Candidatus Abyssubacteria bacterium]
MTKKKRRAGKKGPRKPLMAAVLIIVVLGVALIFSLDALIRSGIETVGSRSLGVEVKLSWAHLSIPRGKLTLLGLHIANPDGYKTNSLFTAKRASVTMRPAALFQDELTIDSIVLKSPRLTVEQSLGGTNISKVLGGIKGKAPEMEKREEKGEEKTYRVKTLSITGAKVTFSSFLTAKAPVTVPLPDIEMKNFSSADEKGLVFARVIEKVFLNMIKSALIEGDESVPSSIIDDVTGDLRRLAPDLVGGALEQTRGAVGKAREAVKGLFGR